MTSILPDLTHGHLIGGRVRYAQPATGFRSGIEPVILAAAVPARAGERILEAGTGCGAALLCLSARVPGIVGVGVDIDPALTAIAAMNAADNAPHRLEFIAADLAAAPIDDGFDHACANPPYHHASGTRSRDPMRDRAKRAEPGLPEIWVKALSGRLRHRGSLTLILPAASSPAWIGAMADADCPVATLFPLWPRAGRPAKLVVLQGIRRGRSPMLLAAGLTLHGAGSAFTPETEAILRHGAELALHPQA